MEPKNSTPTKEAVAVAVPALLCAFSISMVSLKQKLISLLEILNCENRITDVEAHVLKARELYVTLPYQYPGDDFVYDFYREGLSSGYDFEELYKGFEDRLSMNQSFLLAASSMGLHYHNNPL